MLSRTHVVLEAFGCKIAPSILQSFQNDIIIINIEYLNTEKWAVDLHLISSYTPVGEKYFFMPSLYKESGGVLFDSLDVKTRSCWKFENILKKYGVLSKGDIEKPKKGEVPEKLLKKIVVFSYSQEFSEFYQVLKNDKESNYLLILCGEKTQKSYKEIGISHGKDENVVSLFMPVMSQLEFDALVSQVDLNFVRGEDSFVRAAISGKPFLWQAYKQDESYHIEKVKAFLEVLSPYIERELFQRYSNILTQYNMNRGESIIYEEYEWLVDNLEVLEKSFKKFAEYIVKNCNLVYNLISFITLKQI